MTLAFVPEEGGAHAPVRVSVPLTIRAEGTAPAALAPTDQVYVLQLDETSAVAFADAQQDIIALQAADVEGAGSLGIQVTGGCVMDAVPEVFAVATWLRSDPAGSWVQLTRRGDLFEVLPADEAAALRTALQPC